MFSLAFIYLILIWFAFFWWLVIAIIFFTSICWLYFLGLYLFRFSAHVLTELVLFVCMCVLSSLYILDVTLCQMKSSQIFSFILLVFSSLHWLLPLWCSCFLFWYNPVVYFCCLPWYALEGAWVGSIVAGTWPRFFSMGYRCPKWWLQLLCQMSSAK